MPDRAATKARILDAAEAVFAREGFSRASLRRITTAAGVNLAAANYHFGTKAALVEAVFSRRLAPLNRDRIRRLERVLAEGGGVGEVLQAFLGPLFGMLHSQDPGEALFVRVLARSYLEEVAGAKPLLPRLYANTLERFVSALRAALPALPLQELLWRLHFVSGATSYAFAGRDALGLLPAQDAVDPEEVSRRLIPFLTAGLAAPLTSYERGIRESL